MRRAELAIVDRLREGSYTVTELADAIHKSQNWTSELVSDLEARNLVRKDGDVELVDSYETRLLVELIDTYDVESILTGKREDLLKTVLDDPMTVSELEVEGFAKSTVYDALGELRSRGVVEQLDSGEYRITDETLRKFLETQTHSPPGEVTSDGERIVTNSDTGQRTAFSAFRRYGVDYFPQKTYRYQGNHSLGLEDVLIHAVRVAETKKQVVMCCIFYLKHRQSLDTDELWRLANEWGSIERWADVRAFLDQRQVQNPESFLPWEEFTALARDYGVYPRGKHSGDSLLDGLADLGDRLDRTVDVYLLGGGNLILRDLKDSTKDIDVVVDSEDSLGDLATSLRELGYQERRDLEAVYEQMNPSIVLEKEGFPRWDVFAEVVADGLRLTVEMKERVDVNRTFGRLDVKLLSLTDIFLFKAITDREGDLEDAALIARRGDVAWELLFEELQRQEDRSDQLFSFAVLDTLDLLEQRHDIETPIHDELISYCLENALLVSLRDPKTIEDLREELDFPDHRIYNKLRKLEDQGRVEVDRSGKLNTYRLSATER